METKEIDVTKIKPSKANSRTITKQSVKELALNISEVGLINPITVVKIKDKYEIVAGNRRFVACQTLGFKQVSCSIIKGDDKRVQTLRITENMHRENLSPFEEAQSIEKLTKLGKTFTEIAADLGLTDRFVARRSQLNNLSAKWKQALVDDEDIKCWPVSCLELIVRYPEETQDELLEKYRDAWWADRADVHHLTRELAEIEPMLANAPFDTSDPDLWEDAGACTKCEKRSSCQPLLFHDNEKAIEKEERCLDLVCWTLKKEQVIEVKRLKAIDKHGDGLIYVSHDWTPEKYPHGRVIGRDGWEGCKKSDKGAKPAFIIRGPKEGNFVWVKVSRARSSSNSTLSDGKPKTMKQKEHSLKGLRLKWVASRIETKLDSGKCKLNLSGQTPIQKLKTVLTLLLSFGMDQYNSLSGWNDRQKLSKDSPIALVSKSWPKIRSRISQHLGYIRTGDDALKAEKHLKSIADMLGLDWAELWKLAVSAKPEPKAWKKTK